MPTIREIYFQILNKKSTYLTENVIRSLLIKANEFKDANDLYLSFENECKNLDELKRMLDEVEEGKPYQYVIHSAEFLKHDFYVDERVLIPRNETEELVLKISEILNKKEDKSLNLLDVCTGSGCIAIVLDKMFDHINVSATDISNDALEVAKLNNQRLNANVKFYQGNLVDPLLKEGKKFDILVSNPPYIKSEETVDEMVLKYEPHLALFANPDIKFYCEMIIAIPYLINDGGLIAFEIEDDMEDKLKSIIEMYLPKSNYRFEKDLYGHTRFLFINYMKSEKESLKEPIEILRRGGIVCFPTETVMGLGVIYDNISAYTHLNEVKGRPEDKPYTLMLDDWKNAEKYAYLPSLFYELLDKCGDYPMTFLLKRKDNVQDYITHGTDIIGIRVPNHAQIKELIKGVGKPLLVPSANKSGEKPAMSSEEAKSIFKDEVDYYIEGKAIGGKPSTIIDISNGEIKIIREGELTLDEIKRRFDK